MKNQYITILIALTICLNLIIDQAAYAQLNGGDKPRPMPVAIPRTIYIPDHAKLDREAKKQHEVEQALTLMQSNPEKSEKWLIELEKHPDTSKHASFYFELARCQDSLGKHKEALENYRKMANAGGWQESYLYRAHYGLCALGNGKKSEAINAMQVSIDRAIEIGIDVEGIMDIPNTSDANVLRAHAYLLLGYSIQDDKRLKSDKDKIAKSQEYLRKSIELGRKTTPNAYLKMAEYTRLSNPSESRKYLETLVKLHSIHPMHAEEARKRLKDYPPVENEKSTGK
jgi:tetratricopeptide (TPR) repeat protein